jgi:glycosyltransferase involved in cell wall biosynthesis
VRPGDDGLLVPADNAAALADAIEQRMRDRDLRLLYASNARQIVVDEFSSEHIAKAIVSLYARLLTLAPNESRQ